VDTASEVINSVAETGILIGFANTKVGREEWSRCVFWVGWMWHVVGKRSRWNDNDPSWTWKRMDFFLSVDEQRILPSWKYPPRYLKKK
jgi:hypothetical protein